MNENKNLFFAVIFSMLILGVYYHFFPPKPGPSHTQEKVVNVQEPVKQLPEQPSVAEEGEKVQFEGAKIKGSFRLKGGQIDDVMLKTYKETVDKDSKNVHLLSEISSKDPYYIDIGWISETTLKVPGEDALWERVASDNQKEIKLRWDNGQGVVFERVLSVDDDYMITVKQIVHNSTNETLKLHPVALTRRSTSAKNSTWTFHEGAVGFLGDKLEELAFEKMEKSVEVEHKSVGGWAGFTDKYWLVALVPDQKQPNAVRYRHLKSSGRYQVDMLGGLHEVKPNEGIETVYRVYVGAKELKTLDAYENALGIKHFDKAIDYGYFYVLTKPLYYVLVTMKENIGNLGICILLLTVLIKMVLFPLANKSYHSMSRMKKIQPKVQELQKRYKDDKQKLSQEMMALYKREKVNPAGGCLPQLIQFPVMFALYKVFLISIEMHHAPFLWWIKDLSAKDTLWFANLFGMVSWTPPEFLQIGVWPLLMCVTMFIQQKMSPPPSDPSQAKVMLFMPVMFLFMFSQLASGIVVYWTWSNLLSILQQWVITRSDENKQNKKIGGGREGKADLGNT